MDPYPSRRQQNMPRRHNGSSYLREENPILFLAQNTQPLILRLLLSIRDDFKDGNLF
jgi:hypothetical protein